jgi:Family of unknown function (DUF5989)
MRRPGRMTGLLPVKNETDMSEPEKQVQQEQTGGALAFLWQRKVWWLLPLGVLVLLLTIIYVLGHLSAADSEMYPTTQLMHLMNFLSC